MGTITITQSDLNTVLNNRPEILLEIAGATPEQARDGVYDPIAETLTSEFVSTAAMQNAFDNYATLYSAWVEAKLPDIKEASYDMIDKAAEKARLRYITDGAAQALVYQRKAEQARQFIEAGYPADTSAYPFIEADMAAYGITKEQAADEIALRDSQWVAIGASIEELRLGGKAAVYFSNTVNEATAARDSAITALDAI